jgi:dethiobiotin synthetase
MAGLFITGTGTDVGKTYVTAGLIRALTAAGRPLDLLKPVVSGFDPDHPEGSDPAELLAAAGLPLTPETLEAISPWRYRAPLSPPLAARLQGSALDAGAVIGLCKRRAAEAGERLLLAEGAGGVMSPLDDELTMLDLARELGLPVLLVAGSYLGTISHTLTAAAVLAAAGAPLLAVAVSESPDAPALDETLDALRRHLGGTPVHVVERGGAVPQPLFDLVAGL